MFPELEAIRSLWRYLHFSACWNYVQPYRPYQPCRGIPSTALWVGFLQQRHSFVGSFATNHQNWRELRIETIGWFQFIWHRSRRKVPSIYFQMLTASRCSWVFLLPPCAYREWQVAQRLAVKHHCSSLLRASSCVVRSMVCIRVAWLPGLNPWLEASKGVLKG